jgi:3-mercaptopyruvate sulfurtransferase SseA
VLTQSVFFFINNKGGHIPGSTNVPAAEMYDRANELIDTLEGVSCVYFHCALSQVRGSIIINIMIARY